MSTATHTIDATHFTPPAPPARTPRIRRIAKAEWTKLRTLPSTWRTVVMAMVISVALGAILCVSQAQQWSKMTAGQRQMFDPTACSLFGIVFVGAVLLAALGVRAMTAEYVTGMIRSTFAATPTRRRVLAAKAGVTAAFVFPVALLTAVVSFEVGQRVFTGKHLEVSFAHPGVLQAVVFGALAVSLIAVIGVGSRRPHPTHRSSDHGTGAGHRGRRHARPAASGRPPPVRARDRTPGRRHGQPLGGTPEARHCRCGPRRLCGHRLGGGLDPDVAPRRLTHNRTDRPAPGPTNLNRLEKSMNNALTNPPTNVRTRSSPHRSALHRGRGYRSKGHRPDRHDNGGRAQGVADRSKAPYAALHLGLAHRAGARGLDHLLWRNRHADPKAWIDGGDHCGSARRDRRPLLVSSSMSLAASILPLPRQPVCRAMRRHGFWLPTSIRGQARHSPTSTPSASSWRRSSWESPSGAAVVYHVGSQFSSRWASSLPNRRRPSVSPGSFCKWRRSRWRWSCSRSASGERPTKLRRSVTITSRCSQLPDGGTAGRWTKWLCSVVLVPSSSVGSPTSRPTNSRGRPRVRNGRCAT